MKAVITNDQGNQSLLKLRLVAEGANDRTLMLLLELQYPMIQRLHSNSGTSPGALPESVEVPIAHPNENHLSQEAVLPLYSGVAIKYGDTWSVRSDPWEHSSLLGVKLWILEPLEWEILHMTINGRYTQGGGPWDIHLGAYVELTVKRAEHSEPFEAFKLFEAFFSKTEAEAVMYRTARNCKSTEEAEMALDAAASVLSI
jgi:hypothetical protein